MKAAFLPRTDRVLPSSLPPLLSSLVSIPFLQAYFIPCLHHSTLSSSLSPYLGTKITSPGPWTTRISFLTLFPGSSSLTSKGRLPRASRRLSSSPGGYNSHSFLPQTLADQLYDLMGSFVRDGSPEKHNRSDRRMKTMPTNCICTGTSPGTSKKDTLPLDV